LYSKVFPNFFFLVDVILGILAEPILSNVFFPIAFVFYKSCYL
jgi:hypothetical protein